MIHRAQAPCPTSLSGSGTRRTHHCHARVPAWEGPAAALPSPPRPPPAAPGGRRAATRGAAARSGWLAPSPHTAAGAFPGRHGRRHHARRPNGHMTGHRQTPLGRWSSRCRSRGLRPPAGEHFPIPGPRVLEADRAAAAGRGHSQAGAGNPFRRPGDAILPDEIRVPAPARRNGNISDTPGRVRGNRRPRRDGGRVLSHLQEPPLARAGSRRALAQTGACGQLGSRTANRMAVPSSPSIRERACPARPGPAWTA